MKTKILYEDSEVIVVHKPGRVATQTSKIGEIDVVSELKNYLKGGYLGVVHRLDQPVEGVLVFAKTKAAASYLSKELVEGTLNKHYYAITCGQQAQNQGTLVDYMYHDENKKAIIVDKPTEAISRKYDVKKAILNYKVVKELSLKDKFADFCKEKNIISEEKVVLFDVHIETGRFHQIRAQLSHFGMPILGDRKYGNELSLELSKLMGVRNVALYAYEIEFKHPTTQKLMNFKIEPDFVNF